MGGRGWGLTLWLWVSLAPVGWLAAQDLSNSDCLTCHADPGLLRVTPAGDTLSLFVDGAKFAQTPHGGFDCLNCHSDIAELPHPERLAPVDCAQCHTEVVAAYQLSIHGQARAGGFTEAPTCTSCHGDIHQLLPRADPSSPLHPTNLAQTCAICHARVEIAEKFHIPIVNPVASYLESVHARAVAAGKHAAVCSDCHGSHSVFPGSDPRSQVYHFNVPATCGTCHQEILAVYQQSVHGQAVANGNTDAPVCSDCHGEHRILGPRERGSPVYPTNIPIQTCGRCHADTRLSERYGLPLEKVPAFEDSYHGLALRAGQVTVANCASCHGVHDILPSSDPRSSIHKDHLPRTCGQCHPGAGEHFAIGAVHVMPSGLEFPIIYYIRIFYLWLIVGTIGLMGTHNLLDFFRKARRTTPSPRRVPRDGPPRMSLALRLQHDLVMLSFPVLVYTGFALKYPESWWAAPIIAWEEGVNLRGITHRIAAGILIGALLWHLIHLAASPRLRQCLRGLKFVTQDLRDLLRVLRYNLGRDREPPHFGKFSYVEKAEYWAFLWGMVMMTLTGFLLWFENLTLRYLPKWTTDAATVIHFYEAILASLAILVWHFYWTIFDPDVYPIDPSWWHGYSPATRIAERSRMADGAIGQEKKNQEPGPPESPADIPPPA